MTGDTVVDFRMKIWALNYLKCYVKPIMYVCVFEEIYFHIKRQRSHTHFILNMFLTPPVTSQHFPTYCNISIRGSA